MSKILVVIPTYNCALQIGRVLSGFTPELLTKINEIIIIDNRSTDNTIIEAKKAATNLGLRVKILLNNENYGLGGSHKVGFLHAKATKADYIAILHGDNQATTSELSILIDNCEENTSYEALLGSRFMQGSKLVGYSSKRIYGNKLINFIYSLVALRASKDLGSGLNLFKVSSLQEETYLNFANDITFNIDLLLYFFSREACMKFIPITWSEIDQVSNAKNVSVAYKALVKLWKWRIRKPYRELHVSSEYNSTVVYP